MHSTYSKSFQAPTLFDKSNAQSYGFADNVQDPLSASGKSTAFIYYGTNPALEPETAKNINAGLTFEPTWLSGLKLDADFFSIVFNNQISELSSDGFFVNVLQDTAALGSFVERDPTLAQVEAQLAVPGRQLFNFAGTGQSINPSSIQALANIGYVNASSVTVRGIDFTARYVSQPTPVGRFRGDVDTTFYTTYQQRLTPTSVESSPLNTVYNPLKFRAKTNVGWDGGSWHANARLNYSNAYENTNAVNPNCPGATGCNIASWTHDGSQFCVSIAGEKLLRSRTCESGSTSQTASTERPLLSPPAGHRGHISNSTIRPMPIRCFAHLELR